MEALNRQDQMHGISRSYIQELNDRCAQQFEHLDSCNTSVQNIFDKISDKITDMDNTSVNMQGQVQEAFDNHSNMHAVMEQKWSDKFSELEKMMRNGFKNIEDRNAKINNKQIEEYHSTMEKNFLAHISQK